MSNYSRGADFERKTARDLEEFGYVTVRSAGSHSPADLVAMRLGEVLAVQCKRDGRLGPKEWNEFMEFCERASATPIVSQTGERNRGIIYHRLTSRKDGRGRQPWVPWAPSEKGEHEWSSET